VQATIEQPVDAPFADSPALAPASTMVQPLNTRMRRVVDRARQLAGDSAPLLLHGEFGVGKRMLAGLIHRWGPRTQAPAILVRADSEGPLFPAPPAAQASPPGTLILDEIGEFTLAQQDRILALITANEAATAGTEARPAQARIVATASQDLYAAAKKGQFREELLSFLMDEALYLPPLRERPEDIATLAEGMLRHFGRMYHRPGLTLDSQTRLALREYAWPENVHELRNAVERLVLTSKRSEMAAAELQLPLAADSSCSLSGQFLSLDAMEKQHILRVIRATATLEEAARILRVDITTLWRKRRRYGV